MESESSRNCTVCGVDESCISARLSSSLCPSCSSGRFANSQTRREKCVTNGETSSIQNGNGGRAWALITTDAPHPPRDTTYRLDSPRVAAYGFVTVGPSIWISRLWLARTPKTPSVVTSFPGPIMSAAGAEKTSVPLTEQPTLPPRTHIEISSVAPCSPIFAADGFAVLPNNVWVSPPSR